MAFVSRPPANMGPFYGAPELNPPSNNLWIGNVSPEVSDTELKSLFEKHGKINSVTLYPLRNYAFVHFREIESAQAAKQTLQGHLLRGNALKIEFAKLAKPCKSLWVAGISQSISKEELEKEFLKFGKLQEFRFLRDRNTAYVDYVILEEAAQALKVMNGKRIGGTQLRVDYLRSQSFKREFGPDEKDCQFPMRNVGPDFQWMGHDTSNVYPELSVGTKRQNPFISTGPRDSQLSNILQINYPPSAIVEEDMLHNAMILFGEIEGIKKFVDRNFAFVEFRSIEEARRAKEGLENKLFNDPRISIEYFVSELGVDKDYTAHFPGVKGNLQDLPFQPRRMDIFGSNHSLVPSNNHGQLPPMGIRGGDAYIRPLLGHHNNFEPTLSGKDFSDSAIVHNMQSPNPQTFIGGPNWRRSSPSSGIVSSTSAGFSLPNRPGTWDAVEGNQLQVVSKKLRSDSGLPFGRMGNQGGFEKQLGLNSESGDSSLARASVGGIGNRQAGRDCIWRGIIAKGGTLVCHARCVLVGESLDVDIPDVVNCSARTGLDLLSKHYEDAIGFSIVFFLPDSEEDFAPYTEFLRYLGSKDRAGVAKFDNGTTLFLVPPSDFFTNVLKVSGPERLYGVVLRFPQAVPNNTFMNPRSFEPQYMDSHKNTSFQREYNPFHQMERTLPLDYSRGFPEVPNLPPKPLGSLPSSSFTSNSVPTTAIASQASLALTPELIATLTSMLPGSSSSGSQIASIPQMNPVLEPTSKPATGPVDGVQWKQEHKALGHNVHSLSQHVWQPQIPLVSNMTSHFQQPVNSHSSMHDHTVNLSSQEDLSSKLMSPTISQQGGTAITLTDNNQTFQQGSSRNIMKDHGINHGTEASRLYGSPVQQPGYPMASEQVHSYDVSQTQPYMPLASDLDHAAQPNQPLQGTTHGVVQENAETEADKNERYKATLLFAADLLSRIHQQSGNPPSQGTGSN